MQDSWGGLTRAEQSGRIPSLNLLATLLGVREVVESPSLEIFKTHLDKVLCTLL